MAVVKNLMVRAGADFSGMRTELKKAQRDLGTFKAETNKSIKSINSSLDSFKTGIGGVVKGIGAALAAIGIGSFVKDAVNDANTFEASLMQIDRQMGASAESFKQWAKDNADAFGLSRLEAVKYGAVYGNLISTFSAGAADTTEKTEELLKASAIVASATGRTMEDTMERIRSGLLGETDAIEDLGININVAMLESTNAFKRFANGKHWEQLSFQTQQQIRLYAILEQASTKYGDEIANNTITRQNMLIAQLKNVRLSLGQAFQPIWNAILPSLIAFATALAKVADFVAQFTRALFGGSDQAKQQAQQTNAAAGAVSGLGDAYSDAGKKAKKAAKQAASFDQLNVLSRKSGDEEKDAGGSPATGQTSLVDPNMVGGLGSAFGEISDKAKNMADQVRSIFQKTWKAIKDGWSAIVNTFGPSFQKAWGEIYPVLVNWKNAFGKAFSDIVKLGEPLKNWFLTGVVPVWQKGVELGGHIVAGFLDSVQKLFSSWWDAIFPVIQKIITDGLPILTDFASKAEDIFRKLFDYTKEIFDEIVSGAISPALQMSSHIIQDFLDIVFGFWSNWGMKMLDNVGSTLDGIKKLWDSLWNTFLKQFITNMLDNITWLWDKHLKGLIEQVGEFVGKLVTGAQEILNKFILPLVTWLVDKLGPTFKNVFSFIGDVIGTLLGVVADVTKGILKSLGGLVDFIVGVFTGNWSKAWQGVVDVFKGIFGGLEGIVKGVINLIIDAVNFMIRELNNIKIDVPDWIGKIPGIPDDIGSVGFNIPTIPKLATGGLAYGPTLAMVGDNKGAANDPEVIAPLSKLADYVGGNNDNSDVVSALNRVESAIQQQRLVFRDKDVGQAAAANFRETVRRTGALPFPV